MRIVVSAAGLSGSVIDEVCALPGVQAVVCQGSAAIRDAIPGADAIVGCPRSVFNDALLDLAGPSLRWIHTSGAGCEEFLTPGLVSSHVVLTNGRIIYGPEVADHGVALLLALARNLHYVLRGRGCPEPIELRGKTALIVGLGGIGMLIAERLSAFGMRVMAVDPMLKPLVSFVEAVYHADELHALLPSADAVLNTAPLTKASRHLFGTAAFARMRPSALFINVSRGLVVDTDALVVALLAGRPRAAGLDVTDPSPLPEHHPLRTMDNVIVTHHTAGASDGERLRVEQLVLTNVRRFLAGQALLNVVDKQRGY